MSQTSATQASSVAKNHKVELLDRFDQQLFEWCGPARTTANAERFARDAYALSLASIYKAQGLSSADVDVDLEPSRAAVAELAAPTTWRVTWRAAYEASNHAQAHQSGLRKRVVVPLLNDAVHADKRCLRAMAAGAQLEIGIWMQYVAKSGLVDVDSCIFAANRGETTRIRLADAALRDAVRILTLRCISPSHGSPGPRRGQPYQGLSFPVTPRPASVRHASLDSGVFRPASLIDWLVEDGFGGLASRLAAQKST